MVIEDSIAVARRAYTAYASMGVAEISGGRGGFDVHAITADDQGHAVALLTGTIRDFVRPVIHVWHVRGEQLAEMWDASLDQAAEDAFWTSALAV